MYQDSVKRDSVLFDKISMKKGFASYASSN